MLKKFTVYRVIGCKACLMSHPTEDSINSKFVHYVHLEAFFGYPRGSKVNATFDVRIGWNI